MHDKSNQNKKTKKQKNKKTEKGQNKIQANTMQQYNEKVKKILHIKFLLSRQRHTLKQKTKKRKK